MTLEFYRRVAVCTISLAVAYILFDFFHGGLRYSFVRLTNVYGSQVIYFGEVVPALILVAVCLYAIRPVRAGD